jgi:hypothetical protein
MPPAHQRFEAHDLSRRQIDIRLIVQHQLPGANRLLQIGLIFSCATVRPRMPLE